MALIAKIDPPLDVDADGVAQIHARPYGAADAMTGEEIFVWTSERSGGYGLAARGTVLEARIDSFANTAGDGTHKELVLAVRITHGAPLRPLDLDQLAPPADGDAARPIYAHALNKITSLEPDVAGFVRSHFEEE